MKIEINEKFKNRFPLNDEEYERLETSLIDEGCRDPLVVWNDILIDGHNRYEICEKFGIDYDTVEMEFESEEEATYWIDKNQLSRRNLTDKQRDIIKGRLSKACRK
jgi:hypothetical protein